MNSLLTIATSVTLFNRVYDLKDVLWEVFGTIGMCVFFGRFLVQWLHSEKHKESRVPPIFWWLSIVGTLILLVYCVHKRAWVLMSGYVFNVVPYSRNLVFVYRKKRQQAQIAELASSP